MIAGLMRFPVCYIAADDQGTGRTAMHTGLTASMTYHYQVFAQVGEDDVARSNIVAVRTAAANDPTTPRYPVAVPTSQDLAGETGTVYLYWVKPTDNGGLDLGNPDIQYQVRTGSNVPWRTGTNAWLDLADASHITGATASVIDFTEATDRRLDCARCSQTNAGPIQGMVSTPYNASVTVSNPPDDADQNQVDVQYRFRIRSKQKTTDNTGKTSGWVLFNSGRGVDMQPDNAIDIPNMPGDV